MRILCRIFSRGVIDCGAKEGFWLVVVMSTALSISDLLICRFGNDHDVGA